MADNVDIFDEIEGLTPVDPEVLSDFLKAMNEEVIPAIVKAIETRQALAAKSRHWPINR